MDNWHDVDQLADPLHVNLDFNVDEPIPPTGNDAQSDSRSESGSEGGSEGEGGSNREGESEGGRDREDQSEGGGEGDSNRKSRSESNHDSDSEHDSARDSASGSQSDSASGSQSDSERNSASGSGSESGSDSGSKYKGGSEGKRGSGSESKRAIDRRLFAQVRSIEARQRHFRVSAKQHMQDLQFSLNETAIRLENYCAFNDSLVDVQKQGIADFICKLDKSLIRMTKTLRQPNGLMQEYVDIHFVQKIKIRPNACTVIILEKTPSLTEMPTDFMLADSEILTADDRRINWHNMELSTYKVHLSGNQFSTVVVEDSTLKFNDVWYDIAIERCVQCIDGNVIVGIAKQSRMNQFAAGEVLRLRQLGYHD